MKKILLLLAIVTTANLFGQQIFTWTNGNNTNLWSDIGNWDLGSVPTPTDDVVFDVSNNSNCTMDQSITEMNNLDLNGYTGTIDANGSEVYVYGSYNQSSGTLDASTYIFAIFGITGITGGTFTGNSASVYHAGNFSLSNGTYNCTSATTDFDGANFTKTSGTFNHNNGTFNFNVAGTTTMAGTLVFNFMQISPNTSSPVLRTVAFGANVSTSTVSLAHGVKRFKYTGTLSVTSDLAIVSGTTNVAAGNTGIFNMNGANATISSSVNPAVSILGNITINTAGVLTLAGNISLSGNWSHTTIGGFNSGTSTVNLCGGTVVSSGTTGATMATFDNLSVPAANTGNILTTSYANIGKSLFVYGTFNCNSSRILLSGNLTHNGTFNTNSSILVLQGGGAQAINGTAGTTTLNSILVNSGVTTLSHPVILLDSIKVTGGTFNGTNMTLRSTNTLKARIAEKTGGTISGNITVQAFAKSGVTDWAVLGVSGVSGQNMSSWQGDFPMSIEGGVNDVTSAGGYFESVQGWKENDAYGYDTTITIATALTPGKGFWVYLGDALGNTGDITISVTGPAVTGNFNTPVTSGGAQGGFNLIANPYASPISWAKVLALSAGMNDAVYIYNADVGQTQYVNGVPSHPATQGASDIIPMGQGFYVQSAGATQVNFSESCKTANNTSANPLLRTSSPEAANPNVGTVIRLKVEGGGAVDYCAIRFHQNATTAFDGQYDAYKMYNSPGYVGYPGIWSKRTAIGTQLNNIDYGVNSIPYAHTQNAVIPVVVKVYGSGSYTISGSDLQNIPNNACITLFDKVTNITHDLRGSDYVCNINDTTNAARFVLTVCADITTDIKSQTASTANNSIGISKDSKGVFVAFDYEQPTDATISVTNILGQTIMTGKKVKASKETMYLDINTNDQLIFVTVETNNNRVTKKILNTK